MSRSLKVFWGSDLVGRVSQDAASGVLGFAYAEAWLRGPDAFPISLSLPLGPRAMRGGPAHAFFANLLPEGPLRVLVARRLGISSDNDFSLLEAIGGECAGALAVVPEEAPPRPAGYRALRAEELAELAAPGGGALAGLMGSGTVRLSLAGAQDKLPVFQDADGRLSVPLGGSPSSQILKVGNPAFRHLCANEVLCLDLARRLGLPVVPATLRRFGAHHTCVVKRYDRERGPGGAVARLHQEDLCQALGIPPARKYEQEGGPTFARCFELVREQSADPLVDARSLLRWLAFNVVAGNADGHAKNLALLRLAPGRLVLAPFFDLVCTAAYPRLDRRLAMGVGGQRDPGQVGRRHWERLAAELGLKPRYVLQTVRELAGEAPSAAERAAGAFAGRYGGSPALQLVQRAVRKQAQRTLTLAEKG